MRRAIIDFSSTWFGTRQFSDGGDNWEIFPVSFAQTHVFRCNGQFFSSQFFPRGKNGPAHSFPAEKLISQFFPWGKN